MKKNRTARSGLFNPRLILALALCSVGASLTMLAFAAPTPGKSTAQNSEASLSPTIIYSAYNAVSPAVRDYLGPDVVPEILAFLDFKVSATDYEFLKRYMEWRMENPIQK